MLILALLAACGPAEPPIPLSESMEIDALMGHLEALEALAEETDQTRVAGTEGYVDSVDYVRTLLEGAGYEVTLDPFQFVVFTVEDAALSVDGSDFVEGRDGDDGFHVFPLSGSADVTAAVVPVDLHLPPGPANSSDSGCQSDDFDGFPSGAVALVQRGACTFAEKVANAVAAGASAVLIFNEGQPGRTETLTGHLGDNQVAVPVLGLSFGAGEALAEAVAPQATVVIDANYRSRTEHNVIAEIPGANPDRVVMVGAHLDSVVAGPGINDNGSGTALVLELALQAAARGWEPENTVRFAWWGAEEQGLVGSWHWIHDENADPDPSRLDPLVAYLNYDMVASGNGYRFVYDGGAREGGTEGSAAIERVYTDYLDGRGLEYTSVPLLIPSDSFHFVTTGVPVGGLYSGAMESKREAWADAVGGEIDVALDPCYHRACDRVENTNPALFAELASAGAHAVEVLAERAPEPVTARVHRQSFDLPRPRGCHDDVQWDR